MIEYPDLSTTLLAGSSLGLLLLTKFSAAGYFPIALILLVWLFQQTAPAQRWVKFRPVVIAHVGCFFVAWAVIWMFFGFARNPGNINYHWDFGSGTYLSMLTAILRKYSLLPDPYVHELAGLRLLLRTTFGYVAEHLNVGGRWFFFPVAFLVKTPLPMLVALGVACFGTWMTFLSPNSSGASMSTDWHKRRTRTIALWIGAVTFLAMAMLSDSNIGHRHILPIYPPLFVLAGSFLVWLGRNFRLGPAATTILLVASVAEAVDLHPREHAYFNQIAGGPSNGFRWLADSSLAAAAELPLLSKWEDNIRRSEPAAQFYLVQMTAFPAAYGSSSIPLLRHSVKIPLSPGYYIFDATALLCGPQPFSGNYSHDYEREFQKQRMLVASDSHEENLPRYMQLAVSRLAAICLRRRADARVGDGYFVYRVTATDLESFLSADLPAGLPELHAKSYSRSILSPSDK